MNTRLISVETAREVCTRALEAHGVPEQDAVLQIDLLLEAELRGRPSHGLMRLPRVMERIRNGVAVPGEQGSHVWKGQALLEVDGRQGLGPVVACGALARISARARETGVAAAAIHHNNHLGMLAFYAERVAAAGQILIAMSTSEALVHPWGGRRALLGTNPIAIGVPASPRPFVLDMATSAVSMGQIHDYAARGRTLRPGWALDGNGDPTVDAQAAKGGAIAPFGEAKGYAFGLALEVLIASLTASALGADVQGTLDATRPCNKGDVFVVIEPASGAMAERIAAYLDEIRGCAPINPAERVSVPGDRAHAQRAAAMGEGVQLTSVVWDQICNAAERHGASANQGGVS